MAWPPASTGNIQLKDLGGGVYGSSLITPNSYYVDLTGSDLNDGRLVSEGGTGPWATLEHALVNVPSSKTCYLRGGTHTPIATTDLKFSGSSGADASNRTIIKQYPGEVAVIDCASVPLVVNYDNKSNWSFEDFTLINCLAFAYVGEDVLCENVSFKRIVGAADRGGDNQAIFRLSLCDEVDVTGCDLTGPGHSVHQNTGVLYTTSATRKFIFSGNIIKTAPIGIHLKHGVFTDYGSIIENNFLTDTTRWSVLLNSNYITMNNNLIGYGSSVVRLAEANGVPGGDYNVITNNTFYSANLDVGSDHQGGGGEPGSVGNVIQGNVFVTSLPSFNENGATPHGSTTDYNLYQAGASAVSENGTNYTLPEWVIHYGQDANSVQGSAVLSGVISSSSPKEDYILGAGSPGKGDNVGGADMGANISEVAA